MINEKLEVANLLAGVGIDDKQIFRQIYLLAKYCIANNMNLGVAKEFITDWTETYEVTKDINITKLLKKAGKANNQLWGDTKIYVSEEDIRTIKRRFDGFNNQKLALALLLYAKADKANGGGDIHSVSLLAIAHWLGTDYANMMNRNVKDIVLFGYVEKLDNCVRKWNQVRLPITRYKMLVPCENCGEYLFVDNDIDGFFNAHFS